MKNNSHIIGKRIPLTTVFQDNLMILLQVNPVREFSDGAYTDRIIAHKYEVVETTNFTHLSIKLEQLKPLMSDEQLQHRRAEGQQIHVEFINPTIMAYLSKNGTIEDSLRADDVRIVDTENS